MKKVTCNLFHEPVEISKALIAVASQEGNDGPKYDLMVEAADRIRLLESLLAIQNDVISRFYDCHITGERIHAHLNNCLNDWVLMNKDVTPEFVKIVEDNFWGLLV